MQRRLISKLLRLLLVIGLLAAPAQAAGTRIITGHSASVYTAAGNYVLYHDSVARSLRLHDLRNWQQTVVERNVNTVAVAMSDRSAAYVLHTGDKEGVHTLYVYHVDTGKKIQVPAGRSITNLQFAGGKVIWSEPPVSGAIPFYSFDPETGEQRQIATVYLPTKQTVVSDGRYLVWIAGPKLVSQEIATGRQQRRGQFLPFYVAAMDQGRAVFTTRTNTSGCTTSDPETIWLWDLTTNTQRDIGGRGCVGSAYASRPAIRGDRFVYADSAGSFSVRTLNLQQDGSKRLAADGQAKGDLYLANRYVVYATKTSTIGDYTGLSAASLVTLPARVLLPRPFTESPMPTFGDVPRTHWAAIEIDDAVMGSYMRGYPGGSFQPDGSITRAEFLTILMRAYPKAGSPGQPFRDVPP